MQDNKTDDIVDTIGRLSKVHWCSTSSSVPNSITNLFVNYSIISMISGMTSNLLKCQPQQSQRILATALGKLPNPDGSLSATIPLTTCFYLHKVVNEVNEQKVYRTQDQIYNEM